MDPVADGRLTPLIGLTLDWEQTADTFRKWVLMATADMITP
ncbi:hypothetical protein ACQPXH_27730 [Nocardia sp. CA-135953]